MNPTLCALSIQRGYILRYARLRINFDLYEVFGGCISPEDWYPSAA